MSEAIEVVSELELDGEGERFFSQPPGAWEVAHDDWQPEPLSSLERVAMLTTAAPGMAMLAVALTLVCSEALVEAAPRERLAPVAVAYAPPTATEPPVHVRAVVSAPAPPPAIAPAAALAAPVVSAESVVAVASSAGMPRRSAKRPGSAATRARQLLDAGRAAEARDLARDAIRSAPDKAGGYIVLAAALDKLGDRAGMNATFRACTEQATDPLVAACRSLAR